MSHIESTFRSSCAMDPDRGLRGRRHDGRMQFEPARPFDASLEHGSGGTRALRLDHDAADRRRCMPSAHGHRRSDGARPRVRSPAREPR